MKIEQNVGFVKTSDNFEKHAFSLASSREAFQILSSQLYTNKIRAIVRELSCNAVDATKVAGKIDTHPFIVQLPNKMDPTFRIRDYGTGLSPEDVENIYSTYFTSTKRNSNEQIGCLGLGSKTPFCYTDNFQVNSYFNGVKYSYALCMDEEQIPQIMKVSQDATLEENGLEISMAVKPTDFGSFEKECVFTYQWFDKANRPKIIGRDIHIESPSTVSHFKGDTKAGWKWAIVSSNHNTGCYIIMGGVAYRLDVNSFDGAPTEIRSLLSMNLHIHVSIGAVTPAANRESLHLDNKSKNSIKMNLAEIAKDLCDIAQKEVDGCSDMWGAVYFWRNKNNAFDYNLQNFLNNAHFSPTFRGKPLPNVDVTMPMMATFFHQANIGGVTGFYNKAKVNKFGISNNLHFIWRDNTSQKSEKNLRKWLSTDNKANHPTAIYDANGDYSTRHSCSFIFIDQDKYYKSDGTNFSSIKELQEFFGIPDKNIHNLNALIGADFTASSPEEEPIEEKRVFKKKAEAYVIQSTDVYQSDDKTCGSTIESVDLENGEGYYFECVYKKPLDLEKNEVYPIRLLRFLRNTKGVFDNVSIEKLYGLTKSQIEKIGPKWKNIFEFEDEKVKELEASPGFMDWLKETTKKNDGSSNLRWAKASYGAGFLLNEILGTLPDTHELKIFDEKFKKIIIGKPVSAEEKAKYSKQYNWIYSVPHVEFRIREEVRSLIEEEAKKLNEEVQELYDKYPILEVIAPGVKSNTPLNDLANKIIASCL